MMQEFDGVQQTEEIQEVMETEESQIVGEQASYEERDQFLEDDRVKSIIESLLFASDKPVSLATMEQLFKGTNVKSKDIKRVLADLQSSLADPSRGVCLEEVVGGYQLRTKMDNADFLKRLSKARPFRLSGPALEVLSIIAYKQPIVKAEVDEIRGVESGHLVRALMEKGIVQFAGKSELPGRPMLYGTTKKFLEIFGLRNLKELPTLSEIDELLPDGIGQDDDEQVITLGELADSLAEQTKDTYSEGEEDLIKITEKIQSINTSSEFFEKEKERMRAERDRERARDLREALELGEDVDDKDLKWLSRYELIQQEKQQAAEAAAQVTEQAAEHSDVHSEPQQVESLESVAEGIKESSEEREEALQTVSMNIEEATEEDVSDQELEDFLFSHEESDDEGAEV